MAEQYAGGSRPRAWARPSEAEPGSAVADQIDLMRQLAAGRISVPDFAAAWQEARRRVFANGERVREGFERVLVEVFYHLEDYEVHPSLHQPGDLTAEDLRHRVVESLSKLDAL
jgi:hypothetical protein